MIEVALIIFLQSGIIKVLLTYYNIPTFVDLTILSATILLIILIINVYKNKYILELNRDQIFSIFILFLILISIIFSLFYTSSENYAYVKTLHFFTIFIGFIYPLIIKEFSIKKFFIYFVLITLIITLIYTPLFFKSYAILYTTHVNAKAEMIYASYLTVGYIIGISLIINIFSNIYNTKIKIAISIILLSVLFITGARGPLLFIVLIFMLYGLNIFFIKKKLNLKKFFFYTSIICILVISLSSKINIDTVFERSISRLVSLTEKNDNAANDRIERFLFVIENVDYDNLLVGHGFGSFGIEFEKVDLRNYPHNIFLEFLFELGLIGLLLYLFFLSILIKNFINNKNFLTFSLFIFLILNSMKSLSISDSRIMFTFFAIMLIYNCKLENKDKI